MGTSIETSDNEQEQVSQRAAVEDPDNVHDARHFMNQFVNKIFANSSTISLEEKSKFGLYARSVAGRLWFARFITKEVGLILKKLFSKLTN